MKLLRRYSQLKSPLCRTHDRCCTPTKTKSRIPPISLGLGILNPIGIDRSSRGQCSKGGCGCDDDDDDDAYDAYAKTLETFVYLLLSPDFTRHAVCLLHICRGSPTRSRSLHALFSSVFYSPPRVTRPPRAGSPVPRDTACSPGPLHKTHKRSKRLPDIPSGTAHSVPFSVPVPHGPFQNG